MRTDNNDKEVQQDDLKKMGEVTEIALSTMEAEYVALSTSCRDLFLLIDVTGEISKAFSIELMDTTQMHVKIHKDNVGALALGKLEPHHMTPCSKHCAIKYH